MSEPGVEFWAGRKRGLEQLVGAVVGFPVELYWGASAMTGVGRNGSYQVMPDTKAEAARCVFWEWHLEHNEQWYPTPLEAAAAFVREWRRWVSEVGGADGGR